MFNETPRNPSQSSHPEDIMKWAYATNPHLRLQRNAYWAILVSFGILVNLLLTSLSGVLILEKRTDGSITTFQVRIKLPG